MTPTSPPLGRRWLGFWFAKADPTTLGFMRVVTGLLIIYIHFAYSFDLQSFFGESGWYRLEDVNAERNKYPWTMVSFWEWDDKFVIPGYMPEYAHRRKGVVEWYHKLAALPKDQRKAAVKYLDRLVNIPSLTAAIDGLQYAERIPQNELVKKNRLDMITNPSLRTITDTIPQFFEFMKPEDLKEMREELAAFLAQLPTGPDHRRYVFNHLLEINNDQRKLILKFLDNLPDDHDPAERDRRLAYLEKWNNEENKALYLGVPIFSIWFHITDPTSMAITHAVIIGIMVMFTLGLFTRVTSVVVWLAAVSYIHRTQQVLFGMDTMMNLLLIFLMIGPSGKALSLDRWRACRRAEKLSRARNGGELDEATKKFLAAPPMSEAAGFTLRLVQIQFCFIYGMAGFSKLRGDNWWNHQAFWDTMANPEFTMMHYPFYETLMRKFAAIRPLYSFAAAGMVLYTFTMEIGLPFLIWTRLRPIMMIGAVLFHFGIGTFMGLNLFGLLMMTLLLAYMPGRAIREQLFAKKADL